MDRWFILESSVCESAELAGQLFYGAELDDWQLLHPFAADVIPNDARNYDQWSLSKMKCPEAWNIYHDESPIIISTIDTGCDIFHPDIAPNLRINPDEDLNHNGIWDASDNNGIDDDHNGFVDDLIGWDFVNHPLWTYWTPADSEDYEVRDNRIFPDIHGHGTHVTGLAAAVTNNNIGIASAGWNVKSMPLRAGFACFDYQNCGGLCAHGYSDDFAAATQYAVDNGANIISISFGGIQQDSIYALAVAYACSLNVLIFASAGNEGTFVPRYPAAYPGVLAVAALNRSDRMPTWSNHGTWIALAAPGGDVWSTMSNNAYHEEDYSCWSGTSMATPNAAAVAALIWGYDRCLSGDNVRNLLLQSCDNVDSLNPEDMGMLGAGRPNAGRALEMMHHTSAIDDLRIHDGLESAVQLTWINPDVVNRIHVERDGKMIASLPPTSDHYADLTSLGRHWYSIYSFDGCAIGPALSDSAEQISKPIVPDNVILAQNYPNPFNLSTNIEYDLPARVRVELTIYNILGQQIITLMNRIQTAGLHSVVWDGKNSAGIPLASGMYICRLKVGSIIKSNKLLLLK